MHDRNKNLEFSRSNECSPGLAPYFDLSVPALTSPTEFQEIEKKCGASQKKHAQLLTLTSNHPLLSVSLSRTIHSPLQVFIPCSVSVFALKKIYSPPQFNILRCSLDADSLTLFPVVLRSSETSLKPSILRFLSFKIRIWPQLMDRHRTDLLHAQ